MSTDVVTSNFDKDIYKTVARLISNVLENKVSKTDPLKEIASQVKDKSLLNDILLEVFSTLSLNIHLNINNDEVLLEDESFQNLSGLVYDAVEMSLIDSEQAQLYLDSYLLVEAKLIDTDTVAAFEKRVKRINTAVYFKQRKFNLFSESLFGFTSLISILSYFLKMNKSSNELKIILFKHIGRFDLDPNRVLLILFDLVSTLEEKTEIISELIKDIYSKDTILHLISFYLQSSFTFDSKETCFTFVESVLNRSVDENLKKKMNELRKNQLFVNKVDKITSLIPILVKEEVLNLEELINHFPFSKEDLIRYHQLETKLIHFNPMKSSLLEKEEVRKSFDFGLSVLRAANHKMNVAVAFCSSAEVETGISLILSFQEICSPGISLFYLQSVRIALNIRLSEVLKSGSLEDVEKLLTYLKFNMDLNNFKKYLNLLKDTVSDKIQLFKAFREIIIPTQATFEDMDQEAEKAVFELLTANFNYSKRYSLYEDCLKMLHSTEDMFLKCFVDRNLNNTKQILKKTSNRKEVMIAAGQKLKKVLEVDCLTCIQYLLKNIQIYDNLSKLFVSTLTVCTNYNFDIISYLFIKNISLIVQQFDSNRSSNEVYTKFEALGKFIGFFYKKFYDVEISGLFNYIIHSLSKGMVNIVVIIEQLFEKMGCQSILDNVSLQNLSALSGSRLLRKLYKVSKEDELKAYLEHSSSKRNNRIHYLKKTLLEGKFALPLLIHLLILRKRVVVDKEYLDVFKDIVSLSNNVDKITQVFLQVIEFLLAELTPEQYSDLFNDFDLIALEFNLDFSLFFVVVRPLIQDVYKKWESAEEEERDELRKNKWFLFSTNLKNIYTKLKVNSFFSGFGQHPEISEERIKLELLFHSFSLYFVQEPTEAYANEVRKIEVFLEKKKQHNLSKREVEKLNNTKKELMSDKSKHSKSLDNFINFVTEMQKNEEDQLSLSHKEEYSKLEQVVWDFMGKIVLPRCLLSAECAVYCNAFLTLTTRVVPGCSFNIFLTTLPLVLLKLQCCTEREAKNIAMFLKLFLASAANLLLNRNSLKQANVLHRGSSDELLSANAKEYEKEVKETFSKFTKYISEALSSKNDTLIRATLIVGTAITDHFPSDVTDATKLKIMVSKVLKQDNPQTKIMAKRYMALLEQRFKQRELRGVAAAKHEVEEESGSVESGEIEKKAKEETKQVVDLSDGPSRKRKKEEHQSKPEKRPKTTREPPPKANHQRQRTRHNRQNERGNGRERPHQGRRDDFNRRGRSQGYDRYQHRNGGGQRR